MTDRPDVDSSSMRGFSGGSSVFAEAALPQAKQPEQNYDVSSDSMRGFTTTGPVAAVK